MSATETLAAQDFASRTVADIATGLPGATAIFRARKLDFCCGGKVPLAEAAAARGIPLEDLTAELAALSPAEPVEPQGTEAMIALILERYHATHRRELPELVRLARRVEAVHRENPDVPAGLAAHLEQMAEELESHMQKEEQVLFPMLRLGFPPMVRGHIAVMRMDHGDHRQALQQLVQRAGVAQAPEDACGTWRGLVQGVAELQADLLQHMELEETVLFEGLARPRSMPGGGCGGTGTCGCGRG